MLLKRPDGCKLAQKLLDTIWGPDGINTSFGRMDQWTDRRPDGMARSSGRLTGNLNFF
jgi:hypothetical protein